ncbi:MAG TPA: aldehyde dehydrogenase family protein [Blastocatellia bacterium]|nr:aldehyde dehydrogenase family protein [Blastocatellia bacterium]
MSVQQSAESVHESAGTAPVIARVNALFDAQRAHRWTMARTTASERATRLRQLKQAIIARKQDLFDAIHADFRKHQVEVELSELQPVLQEIDHTIKHLAKWMRPRRVSTPLLLFGTHSEVRYEAKGVMLILSPWNYPFYLTINPLVGAIAAGNTAIVKPSEKTPNTSRFIASLVADVFDPREATVVEGEVDVAKALLDLPFDHITFTGSTAVGKIVMAAAAKHLTPVTLELGGKSPAIVDETADPVEAARRIAWGKFLNCGQTCVAPDYVLVHTSRADAFLDALKGVVDESFGATPDAVHDSTDLCRLVDNGAFERVAGLVDDATSRGARVVAGGQRDASDRFIAPTVLADVPDDAAVMQEEIFGPVLPVLRVGSVDEAIAFVQARPKPLALYVFSSRDANVERILAHTNAGGTAVNNVVVHLANTNLPFGGTGASGMGNYHGEFGFREFSHERAVLRQGWPNMFAMFFPPYGEKVRKMVARVTWYVSR